MPELRRRKRAGSIGDFFRSETGTSVPREMQKLISPSRKHQLRGISDHFKGSGNSGTVLSKMMSLGAAQPCVQKHSHTCGQTGQRCPVDPRVVLCDTAWRCGGW